MSIRKFGIFTSYNPRVDLRAEGLGRHLAMFIKGATQAEDVKVSVACPSWSRKNLADLFEEFNIAEDRFEFIGPQKPSLLWSSIECLSLIRKRLGKKKRQIQKRSGRLTRLLGLIKNSASYFVRLVARSRNPFVFVPFALFGFVASPLILALGGILWLIRRVIRVLRSPAANVIGGARRKVDALRSLLSKAVHFIYRSVLDEEAATVVRYANKRKDIPVWYCPAAFWPQVNFINSPTLVCVPDVVPIHFPVGFSSQGGPQMLVSYKEIEKTILGASNFVTYSAEIKHSTLVNRFGVNGKNIHVVRHGASRLDHLTTVSGFPDNEKASENMCSQYFSAALSKSINNWNGSRFASPNLEFLFYPSQFRPNKNVLTLLRAFKWLRREKLLHYKLILTGDLRRDVPILSFLDKYDLHDDVLCMPRLTEKELAGAYFKAALAINPSLAEGGTPFTFTEALSVGTPVIMSDIPVTKETITDETLYEMTTFNGMDWHALADKILWALENRNDLLTVQRGFYESVLKRRNWQHVARDHLDILENIALKNGGNQYG